jgi:hypothetical protein
MKFFLNVAEHIKDKLIWVGVAGLGLIQVGVPVYVGSTLENVKKHPDDPLKCEPLTAKTCEEACEPFKVVDFKPGFYLRYAEDGGERLFTSCLKSSNEPNKGIFYDACKCATM